MTIDNKGVRFNGHLFLFMNDSMIISNVNKFSQMSEKAEVLKEGSHVLVRVSADKGNNNYEGYVKGVKVTFYSKNPLQVGTSFTGQVSGQNGTVIITPEKIQNLQNLQNIENLYNFQDTNYNNNLLTQFFNNLGLSNNEISMHLLKQFKQLEMKFDMNVLNKIYKKSIKFLGKEKKAGEILSLLEKKGITASDEQIMMLLNYLENLKSDDDRQENESYEELQNLINKINKARGSWFLFMIDFVEIASQKKCGQGNIKILFDDSGFGIKIINLDCEFTGKRYLFNINFEGRSVSKIRMNIEGTEDNQKENIKNEIEYKFNKKNPDIKVLWERKEVLTSLCCDEESIFTVEGDA